MFAYIIFFKIFKTQFPSQYEMRRKDEKFRAVKRLLSDEDIRNSDFENIPGNRARLPIDSRSIESLVSGIETPKSGSSAGSCAPLATPSGTVAPSTNCRSTARRVSEHFLFYIFFKE